jgi:hypothetical protein
LEYYILIINSRVPVYLYIWRGKRVILNSYNTFTFISLYDFFILSFFCLLFEVEYRFNLLKRFYQPKRSFPKSRDNISREFSSGTEMVAALVRDFNYLYKVSVYQIKFDSSQAPCSIGTTVVIPIKLEFSASVGFIHKESVMMRGHTVVKN